MKSKKNLILMMTITVLLAGCWGHEDEQKRDCTKPRNQQEQQECAHEASTSSSAIPDTRPTNNKKW